MAGKRNGEQDVLNISGILAQLGKHSEVLAGQLEKAASGGQKLNKEMRNLAKQALQVALKDLRELDKQIVHYQKNLFSLNNEQRQQLELAMKVRANKAEEIQTLQQLTKGTNYWRLALGAMTAGLGSANLAVRAFTFCVEAAEAEISLGLTLAIQAVTVALRALSAGVSYIIELYNSWNQLMGETTQSMSSLARTTGATGETLGEMQGLVGDLAGQFSELGGSISGIPEATEFVNEFAPALRDTRLASADLAESFLTLNRAFGMTADQTANLFRLLNSGALGSESTLDDVTVRLDDFAHSIGALTGQVIQDFSDSSDYVARFGRDGMQAFEDAATQAQAFGFQARQIFQIAERFNTFSQASDSVNQLNAVLGTSISSFELMNEQNPARRVEMLRQAIEDTGVAWSDMDQYQRMTISQTLGLSEAEAARMFQQGVSLEQLTADRERAAAEEERRNAQRMDSEDRMHDLLMQTSSLWDSVDRIQQRITQHLTTILGPLFGEIRGTSLDIWQTIDLFLTKLENSGQAQAAVQGLVNAFVRTEQIVSSIWNFFQRIQPVVEAISHAVESIVNAVSGGVLGSLLNTSSSLGGGILGALASPVEGAPVAQGTGARAIISQAVEGRERQRVASGDIVRERSVFENMISETLEREFGAEMNSFVEEQSAIYNSPVFNAIGGAASSAISAAVHGPATESTATSQSAPQGNILVSILPQDIHLDSQVISRMFWQRSQRA